MTISRRSFFSAVAGAIAGAVASKALAAPSETAKIVAPPTNIVEFCRRYLTKEKIEPVLLQAANCTVKSKIPDCLLEDSPHDWSSHVYRKFATECANQVDRECWGPGGEWVKKIDIPSLKAAMDKMPKYNDGLMTINDFRALEGLGPLPAVDTARFFGYPVHVTPGLEGCWRLSRLPMTLPDGWGRMQCGPYKAADGLPTVDPKDWHLLARGRFDFTLDPHSPPR